MKTQQIRGMQGGRRNNRLVVSTAAVGLMFFGLNAHATLITLTESNDDCSGNEMGNTAVISSLETSCAGGADLTELYKSNFADSGDVSTGEDEKEFADSYTTTFSPLPTPEDDDGPTDARVVWDGTPDPFIDPSDFSSLFALAKDGNTSPTWFGWDLLAEGWDGKMDILFDDLWLDREGSISHVSIFGIRGGNGTDVPAPGVLGLLGIGLLGLGAFARRRRSP